MPKLRTLKSLSLPNSKVTQRRPFYEIFKSKDEYLELLIETLKIEINKHNNYDINVHQLNNLIVISRSHQNIAYTNEEFVNEIILKAPQFKDDVKLWYNYLHFKA
ncbi:MAG: hypothetical protein IPK88_15265 [Saprospiraceae bacterium]|nr:hypothetical protein [Candidatus Defluviibacterium haderslevense]